MAQEVKHTPGPWHACRDGDCECGVVWSGEFPICKVTSGDWGDDYPAIRLVGESSFDRKAEAYMEQITYGSISPDTAKANARLIAAAPEMHRELRGCRCPRPFNSRPDEFTIGECADAGECGCSCGAAIIKAEGR